MAFSYRKSINKIFGLSLLLIISVGMSVIIIASLTTRQSPPKLSSTLSKPLEFQLAENILITTAVTISNQQLLLNGQIFIVKGVGYAPTSIGDDPEVAAPNGDYFTSNYSDIYNRDLPLLRQMGANTVRLWGWQYDADHTDFLDQAYNNGVNPIYVIAPFWLDSSRDISDAATREAIIAEFSQMVAIHKDHPAILMWVIGNELNAPWMFGNSDDLFSLIDEMAQAAHLEEGDAYHPVTTPLADVDLTNTIVARDSQTPNLDIWSVQVYRGSSFGSLFNDYATASHKPLLITEYGIDAYDDISGDEYENIGISQQAIYAESLWNEIETNSDICAGGSIMAYSDEWWKGRHGQTDANHESCPDYDAALHSECGYIASSHPDGYANEEWWGIVRTVDNGTNIDILEPRDVYYTLQSLWIKKAYLPFVTKTN